MTIPYSAKLYREPGLLAVLAHRLMTQYPPHYVRRYRLKSALTQREMAQLLGCQSSATVCQYEANKREPDLRTAFAFRAVFGLAVEELFPELYREVKQQVLIRADQLSNNLSDANTSPALSHKREAVQAILAKTDDQPQSNI